jgi:DNA-binding LacI/PurR family transcriptional regulator
MGVRKRIRLKEISERAGVSMATVSMSLAGHPDVNLQTRERVRSLSQELGYRPPRSARQRQAARRSKSDRFGLVLLGRLLDDDPLLRAIGCAAARSGARIEFHASEECDSPAVIEQALDFASGTDGLILTGVVPRSVLAALEGARVPHVIMGYATEAPDPESRYGQTVTSDMIAMGAAATEYLYANGHRRIGFICERMPEGLWAARWLQGHHSALAMKQIAPDPALVHVAGALYAGGEAAAEAIVALKRPPTAFIVPDARLAASFLAAMKARGITVPAQCIVVSGLDAQVEFYGLKPCPHIGLKMDCFAATTLRQLREIIREPMHCATEVIVPFATRNLVLKKTD